MASQPPAPVPPVAGPSTLKRPIGALDGEDSDGDDLASAGPALTPIAPVKATVTARDGKPHFTVTTTDGAPGVEATLQDLQDGQPGQKPPYAWWTIVRAAIAASPKKRMTLAEVYDAVEARFEVFRNEPDEAWKHAIRHNLSVKPCFKRDHAGGEKGGAWVIDHTVDPNQGRIRKRKKYQKKTAAEKAAAADAALATQTAASFVYRVQPQPPGLTHERIDVPFALSLNRRVVSLAISTLDKLLASHAPGATPLMPDVRPYEESDTSATGRAAKGILDVLAGVRNLVPLPPPTEPNRQPPFIPAPPRAGAVPATPKVSFPELVRICINEAKGNGLTLPQLYAVIESKHSYFRTTPAESWRSTVRQVLSTHACFYTALKTSTPGSEFWHVQADIPVTEKRTTPLPNAGAQLAVAPPGTLARPGMPPPTLQPPSAMSPLSPLPPPALSPSAPLPVPPKPAPVPSKPAPASARPAKAGKPASPAPRAPAPSPAPAPVSAPKP